jgi:hypothetical protein
MHEPRVTKRAVPPGLAVLLLVISGCDSRPAQEENTTQRSTDDSAAVASAAAAAALAGLRADTPAEPPLEERRVGCTRSVSGEPEPEPRDLEDGVVYWGLLRACADGRPSVATIELVEYYEGEAAVREAAKDGEMVDPDVDPVVHVRRAAPPTVLRLGVKPDADIRMFDCEMNGCDTRNVVLDALPWNDLYRFRLQHGMIVYLELPYTP